MPGCQNRNFQQIIEIPAFVPLKYIEEEYKFLQPETPQQMWDNVVLLMNFYSRGACLSKSLTQKILQRSIQLIGNQPNVLYLSDPITLIGDIHGQFFDLLKHLDNINLYSLIVLNNDNLPSRRRKVLFLGDYVDRGNFSVEVMMLLLVLKIYRPKTFYLLRGNHECRQVTQIYNFRKECTKLIILGESKYNSQQIYDLFIDLFWTLPLAAVVNGSFFCVHGGLSEELCTVDDIQEIDRFREISRTGLMCDLLWADPVEGKSGLMIGNKDSQFNRSRNCSIKFGVSMLRKFFKKNQFICLIRAHQVQTQGYGFINWGKENKFPDIITLFSAPNYCGGFNSGAIASIEKNVINVHVLEQKSPELYVLPNFIDAFQLSIPFIISNITELFFYLLSPTKDIIDFQRKTKDRFEIFYLKDMKCPKVKKKILSQQDNESEQLLLQKQQFLFNVYSSITQHIKRNIRFKLKTKNSASMKDQIKDQ